MFASNEDASLHLRSHIISWKSFCVETDVLLRRIYEITCDYFKADTSKELVQFDFISIQKLKEQRNVYGFTAKTNDEENAKTIIYLLVGFVTNHPKKDTPETVTPAGHLFLEDAKDSIHLMCLDIKPNLLGQLVVIPEWMFIPCHNKKNALAPYVEVKLAVLEVFSSSQSPLLFTPTSEQTKASKRDMNLSSRVAYVSPVYEISGSSPFFMVKLQSVSQPIIITGEEKMFWWHCVKPGISVDFCYVKLSKLNKGANDEKDIVRTTSKSTIEISSVNHGDDEFVCFGKENDGLISYIGTITDTSMAERGIFVLDNKTRLIVTHQPCPTYCNGLRLGAKICAYSVHLVEFLKVTYLVCCSSSSVKIVEFSSTFDDHQPFVSLKNCFTKDCQEMRIKDYLCWIQLTDNISQRFPFLKERKAAKLSKVLLNDYFSYMPVRRNIFNEFFSEPHRCIVMSENPVPPPKICSLLTITTMLYEKYVHSSKRLPWRRGDEYDRLSGHNNESGKSWGYKTITPEDIGNAIIVGELVACHHSGKLQLRDSSGTVDIEFVSRRGTVSNSQRDQMYRSLLSAVLSASNCVIVLRSFLYVVEMLQHLNKQAFDYKTYILADLRDCRNTLFLYMGHETSKRPARKRQMDEVDELAATSKRARLNHMDADITQSLICGDGKMLPRLKESEVTCTSNAYKGDRVASLAEQFVEGRTESFADDLGKNAGNLLSSKSFSNTGAIDLRKPVGDLSKTDRHQDSRNQKILESDKGGIFLMFFIRKVAVLEKSVRDGKVSCRTKLNGTIFGKVKTICPDERSVMENRSKASHETSCKGSCKIQNSQACFESVETKEIKFNVLFGEDRLSDYAFLRSGNFYMFTTKENFLNSDVSHYTLRLQVDLIVHFAEFKQDTFVINEFGSAVVSPNCAENIDRLLKMYYKSCRNKPSVRSTLALGSANRDRTCSFSGVIISRKVKVSTPWGVKGQSYMIVLRVKDFTYLDEIAVYFNPANIILPGGCLPGARVQFEDIDIKLSGTKKIYCSASTSSEIRIISFDESDLGSLQDCGPIGTDFKNQNLDYRKTLAWFLEKDQTKLNLTWQVKLDFITVRWAAIYWKCQICKQKVKHLICTRGCPQDLKFVSQMSAIVDDGTSQAYLQIEQDSLRKFLAFPDAKWKVVMKAAKCEEISYQREVCSRQSQGTEKVSRRRQAERMLWKTFYKLNKRPTCLVDCRFFIQPGKNLLQDRVRTFKLGTEEYLTMAPTRINLQAIRIQKVDYSAEVLNIIERMKQ